MEVNGFRGTVCEIGIRTTCLMDVGGNVKIINNSDMKNILNRSDRVSIAASTIDIPYETDLESLEASIPGLMEEIYQKHTDDMLDAPKYLGGPGPGQFRHHAEVHCEREGAKYLQRHSNAES